MTGGVVSSVGKGITTASIGRILKNRKLSLSVLKLDPYLNVDPGTMSPYQHGEVFVTEDGSETDLDLGHYERFIDINLDKLSNMTAGQVYVDVLARERKGEFLGGTIQSVPHVTDAIKKRIIAVGDESKSEVVIVEVGGTVGDIEGQPFLEAIRQLRNEVGRDNVFYIHVTYLPFINATGELKTKPTQHSVKELRAIGIQPDAILCRSEHDVGEDIKDKIAIHCDVSRKGVIGMPTVSNIYQIPLILEDEGLGSLIVNALNLSSKAVDMADWDVMVKGMLNCKAKIEVAVVGKYIDLKDAYISVRESLTHAALKRGYKLDIKWIHAEDIELNGPENLLSTVSGIVVPGGFGPRGIEGMVETAKYAYENKVPYLGLCLGMQVMVISMARHLLSLKGANSTEFSEKVTEPVIDLMPEQKNITDMGGTMRLGIYPCKLMEGTKARAAYGIDFVNERHRHRFEVNNRYLEDFEEVDLIASGKSPDGKLVEIMEHRNHPFMLGVQFHPEFLSRPNKPHPIFKDFVVNAASTIREGGQHSLNIV